MLIYATQDIAVDGWALEILHTENLSYAATCQSVGKMYSCIVFSSAYD